MILIWKDSNKGKRDFIHNRNHKNSRIDRENMNIKKEDWNRWVQIKELQIEKILVNKKGNLKEEDLIQENMTIDKLMLEQEWKDNLMAGETKDIIAVMQCLTKGELNKQVT